MSLSIFHDLEVKLKVRTKIKPTNSKTTGGIFIIFRESVPHEVHYNSVYFGDLKIKVKATAKITPANSKTDCVFFLLFGGLVPLGVN